MEKRLSKRIAVGFKAVFISDGTSYQGVIENLSEKGLNVITSPLKAAIDFIPETLLKLNFQTFLGETLNLQCKVKWACKTLPHRLTNRIGMEIIDPPWDKSNYFL